MSLADLFPLPFYPVSPSVTSCIVNIVEELLLLREELLHLPPVPTKKWTTIATRVKATRATTKMTRVTVTTTTTSTQQQPCQQKQKGLLLEKKAAPVLAAATAALKSEKSVHKKGELELLVEKFEKASIRADGHMGFDFTVKYPYFWFRYPFNGCNYVQIEMLLPTTHPDDFKCIVANDGKSVFVNTAIPSSLIDSRIWQRRYNIADGALGDHILDQNGHRIILVMMVSIQSWQFHFLSIVNRSFMTRTIMTRLAKAMARISTTTRILAMSACHVPIW
jgi:hypothetical protein